jgi:hypothetical protein
MADHKIQARSMKSVDSGDNGGALVVGLRANARQIERVYKVDAGDDR